MAHRFGQLSLFLLSGLLLICTCANAEELKSAYGAGLKFTLSQNESTFTFLVESPRQFDAAQNAAVFGLDNPDRLVIDVPGLKVRSQSNIVFDTDFTKAVRVGKHSDKSRLVIDLSTSIIGVPKVIELSKRFLTISFALAIHEKTVAQPLSTTPKENTQEKWVERKPSKPMVKESVLTHTTQPPTMTDKGKVQAYTVKGNKTKIVQIDSAKSVSKIATPKLREQEITHPPKKSISNPPTPNLAEEEPLDREQQVAKLKQLPLQHKKQGFTGGEMKEHLIEYDNIPPPLANPFQSDYTWAWQIALIMTFVCLVIVLLKRRSVLDSLPDGQIVPWFDVEAESLREMYSVLDCNENSPDEEIKEKYRQLAKAFHSDKLNAQDLPDEVRQLTEDQFKRVQHAYDVIKRERGIA